MMDTGEKVYAWGEGLELNWHPIQTEESVSLYCTERSGTVEELSSAQESRRKKSAVS